jgi:hypothetical protein
VRLVRGKRGKVTSIWVGSGELLPEAALKAELLARFGGETPER